MLFRALNKVAGTLRVPWKLRHAERAYYINAPDLLGALGVSSAGKQSQRGHGHQ
jgi:hypothetical protein